MLEFLVIQLNMLNARRQSERGASAVEYGLLVAGIAALIVAVVFLFGGFVKGIFSSTCTSIDTQSTAITGTCS
ncbi:Flp family type IVb pilin [Nocardioidaceae bacterium]|nr:Flp family type IVb pilin [Nocardioidaceae bacterium]